MRRTEGDCFASLAMTEPAEKQGENAMATRHNAFISGAGRNIGRATALELARRGCNVIVNGARNRAICDTVAAEAAALGVEAVVLMGDVGDAAEAKRIAAAALARFGTIDILV